MIRRFVFRNDRLLFGNKDVITGKDVLSGMPPQSSLKIYETKYWLSDAWDPMDYGREYDFSRPFLEQFRELMYNVPWQSRSYLEVTDADYCNNIGWSKNCYLCFNCGNLENCAYAISVDSARESFDVTSAKDVELCYENFDLENCYRVFYSNYCIECRDVWFSRDLTGCSNCFGCVNLRGKQYYIFNRPYSKEAYFKELEKLDLGSHAKVRKLAEEAENFWNKFPYRFQRGWRSINVSGDLVYHSKNAHSSYNTYGLEDSKYCQNIWDKVSDSYDLSEVGWCERSYEFSEGGVDGSANVKFSWNCWPAVHDIEYSTNCRSSANLFGCVGLRKKSYCILNRQYSKEDFQSLREKIVRHMDEMPYRDAQGRTYRYGEFFPPEFSPLAYNETIAEEFFPLKREEAEEGGYVWREEKVGKHSITTKAGNLPDNIGYVEEKIKEEVLGCVSCEKAYRIIPMEFDFYKKIGIPLPRSCPSCRYLKRLQYRNPPVFYKGKCRCAGEADRSRIYKNSMEHSHGFNPCLNEFQTSHNSDHMEIVYCEECYQNEIA